jgi:hypothetical protein
LWPTWASTRSNDVQVAIAIKEQFQRRKLPFEKLLMVDGR